MALKKNINKKKNITTLCIKKDTFEDMKLVKSFAFGGISL